MNQMMVRQGQQIPVRQMLSDEMAFADAAVKSGLLPVSVDSAQKALAIILKGSELGLKRMQSFKHLFVVNGQIGMDTALLAALYQRRGHSFEVIEKSAMRCTIRFIRRNGSIFTYALTMEDARQANWPMMWDKGSKSWKEKPTWKAMPAIMLYNRTLSNGIRTVDPGCVFGTLTEDEMFDFDPTAEENEQTIEVEARVVQSEERKSTRQEPTPEAGWETWPAPMQHAFWTAHARAGMDEGAVHQEYGVSVMAEWQFSIDQTRPVLEVLEYQPEITIAEKKKALGIEKLAEIAWHGWSAADCKAAINETIGAAQ
ncbi:MAG: hypothetical protein ACYCZF_13635 [Anaerolineae bacterium]